MECVLKAIKSASIKAAFLHWTRARAERLMPRRSDIDPLEMVEALPYAWIYRRNADGEFYCALAGAKIETAWGGTIMNKTALDIIGPKFYPRIKRRWLYILQEPAILYSELMESPLSRPVERLILPVSDKDGVPVQVLGISHYLYPQAGSYKLPIKTSGDEANFYRLPSFKKIEFKGNF